MENGEGEGGEVEEDSDVVQRAKDLEVQAVRAAEEGNLEDALELLTRAVNEAPNYASPYNNRAQVTAADRPMCVTMAIEGHEHIKGRE